MAPAHAAQIARDGREEGAQTRVRLEPSGVGSVDYQFRYRVVHGAVHAIDIFGVDPAAMIEPRVLVSGDDGREVMARAERGNQGGVHLVVDDAKGLTRGVFNFEVHWQIDLLVTGSLSRHDTGAIFVWSSPRAIDGFDGARTVFEFPAAPDVPRPISAATGVTDDATGAIVRRSASFDELELVIPHVSPGEVTVSTIRLDPRAFPGAATSLPLPKSHAAVTDESNRVTWAILGTALGLVAFLFSLAMSHVNRAVSAACRAWGAPKPRGVVPVPDAVRIALGGLSFATGIGLQAYGEYTSGAACVALATLLSAIRPPLAPPCARGPGSWAALTLEQVKSSDGRDPSLQPATTRMRYAAVAALGILAIAGVALGRWLGFEDSWLPALDVAPAIPLLLSGVRSQPRGQSSAVDWIMDAYRKLRRSAEIRAVLWGRIAGERAAADELRVLVMPKCPLAGLLGIELGLAWSATPSGWLGTPEVLVRVRADSPASAALSSALAKVRTVSGRHPDERVARLIPRTPTLSSALTVLRAAATHMTDRRTCCASPWKAPERRRPAEFLPSISAPIGASSRGIGVTA